MFQQVSLSGIGFSSIVPVDYRQRIFSVGLQIIVPSTVSAVTYNVQVTIDGMSKTAAGQGQGDNIIPTSITRSTTTATVVSPNHGLNVNDVVIVFDSDPTSSPNTDSGATTLDGTFLVASITDLNTFTYTVTNSGTGAAGRFVSYIPQRFAPASTSLQMGEYDGVLTGVTTELSAQLTSPVRAVRLNVSAYTGTGNVTMQVIQGPSSA